MAYDEETSEARLARLMSRAEKLGAAGLHLAALHAWREASELLLDEKRSAIEYRMALGNLVLYCTLAGAVATDVPMATPASSRGRYDPR